MQHRIAIIGLGYVGLPLAVEFGKFYPTLGFDINTRRIEELKGGFDRTLEIEAHEFAPAVHLRFTTNADDLKDCNTFIVTVPTPIDSFNRPDITLLKKASATVEARSKKAISSSMNPRSIPAAPRRTACPSWKRPRD